MKVFRFSKIDFKSHFDFSLNPVLYDWLTLSYVEIMYMFLFTLANYLPRIFLFGPFRFIQR